MSHSSSRRVIRWENIQGPRGIFSVVIATALGAGLFPIAPGTMGTLVGMPIAYFSSDWPIFERILLWLFLLIVGTWSAKIFDELMGTQDNQNIVIDEVVGLGITAWTAGQNLHTLIAAFILFRFFDILKPSPVRQIDEWSRKKASHKNHHLAAWWSGFGVMADDLVAGFQGLLVILILQKFHILP